MLDEENERDGRTFAYTAKAMDWSLLLQDSSNNLLRCGPVISEAVPVSVLIRRSANARKHVSLAGACQGILRD